MSRKAADTGAPPAPKLMVCKSTDKSCGGCPHKKPHEDKGRCGGDSVCHACSPYRKPRKPGKRLASTPRGKVRAVISRLFNVSRERAAALKRDGYACSCGAKQSKAKGREVKVQVHHLDGGGINEIVDLIFKRLLCPPDRLRTVCVPCHDAISHLEQPPALVQGAKRCVKRETNT